MKRWEHILSIKQSLSPSKAREEVTLSTEQSYDDHLFQNLHHNFFLKSTCTVLTIWLGLTPAMLSSPPWLFCTVAELHLMDYRLVLRVGCLGRSINWSICCFRLTYNRPQNFKELNLVMSPKCLESTDESFLNGHGSTRAIKVDSLVSTCAMQFKYTGLACNTVQNHFKRPLAMSINCLERKGDQTLRKVV